jgi:hypothetical protein
LGPYELVALYLLIPIMSSMVWFSRRYETVGKADAAFEAWCRDTSPAVFALLVDPDAATDVVAELSRALDETWFTHDRGRDPWTRYVFALQVKLLPTKDAILVEVKGCTLKRKSDRLADLGETFDRLVARAGAGARELWMHAELNEEDDAPGIDRRLRGWLAPIERGAVGTFSLTRGLPDWATIRARAASPFR